MIHVVQAFKLLQELMAVNGDDSDALQLIVVVPFLQGTHVHCEPNVAVVTCKCMVRKLFLPAGTLHCSSQGKRSER